MHESGVMTGCSYVPWYQACGLVTAERMGRVQGRGCSAQGMGRQAAGYAARDEPTVPPGVAGA